MLPPGIGRVVLSNHASVPNGPPPAPRPPSASSIAGRASPVPLPALIAAAALSVAIVAAAARRPKPTGGRMAPVAGRRQTTGPLMAQEWNPSMGTSLSDLFGSSSPAAPEEPPAAAAAEFYQDLPLESEAGVNYSVLKQVLKDQQWELADNETRRLLIELAGPAAEAREYVWPTEVARIPAQDMQMLDRLWMNYSGGRFGYGVQRKLWAGVRGNWTAFFQRINWVTGENNDYRKWPKGFLWTADAEAGHLPLTNALRGTGLIQAVLEHPAFGGPLKNKQVRK
jgi:hypothetical protein